MNSRWRRSFALLLLVAGGTVVAGKALVFLTSVHLPAGSVCQSHIFLVNPQAIIEVSQPHQGSDVKTCDPDSAWAEIQKICADRKSTSEFTELDWHLVSYQPFDGKSEDLARVQNACGLASKSFPRLAPASPPPESPKITSTFLGNENRNQTALVSKLGAFKPLWRAENGNVGTHAASKSSPAVDHTGVYVGGDSSWFHAYDLAGQLKWKLFVSEARRGFHGTAALDDEAIYIGAYNGKLYKLDKKTGRVLWVRSLGLAIGASPLLSGEYVYISVETDEPGGFLAKLRRRDGALVWKSPGFKNQPHSSPAFDAKTGFLIVGANDSKFRAIRESDGSIAWEKDLGGEIKSTAALSEGSAFITTWDQHLYRIATADGSVRWRANLGTRSQAHPAPWPEKNIVVVTAHPGRVLGVEMDTGQVKWNWKKSDVRLIGGAVLASDGKRTLALTACASQKLCALDEGGRIVTETQLKGELSSVPVLFDNTIYVSEDAPGEVVAFRLL